MLNIGRWIYEDAEYFAADLELDPKAAKRWLPWGVPLRGRPTATFFVARFVKNTFGAVYNEAGIFFSVRRGLASAAHCPWMVVNHDVPLILGRDLLGFPKKLAEISLERSGDKLVSRVTRQGNVLVELEATIGEPIHDAPPILGQRFCNVRGGLGLPLPRLVSFRPKEQINEARTAHFSIRFGSSDADPLGQLGLGAFRRGIAYRVNIGAGFPPHSVGIAGPGYLARTWAIRNA